MKQFGFLVDENMLEIIELFNDYDFDTNNSCQNQYFNYLKKADIKNNVSWICFDDSSAIEDIMNILDKFDSNLFMELHDKWSVVIGYPDDDDEDDDNDNRIRVGASLRFPSKDLSRITKAFKIAFYKIIPYYEKRSSTV